jgi:hypothetical protein
MRVQQVFDAELLANHQAPVAPARLDWFIYGQDRQAQLVHLTSNPHLMWALRQLRVGCQVL